MGGRYHIDADMEKNNAQNFIDGRGIPYRIADPMAAAKSPQAPRRPERQTGVDRAVTELCTAFGRYLLSGKRETIIEILADAGGEDLHIDHLSNTLGIPKDQHAWFTVWSLAQDLQKKESGWQIKSTSHCWFSLFHTEGKNVKEERENIVNEIAQHWGEEHLAWLGPQMQRLTRVLLIRKARSGDRYVLHDDLCDVADVPPSGIKKELARMKHFVDASGWHLDQPRGRDSVRLLDPPALQRIRENALQAIVENIASGVRSEIAGTILSRLRDGLEAAEATGATIMDLQSLEERQTLGDILMQVTKRDGFLLQPVGLALVLLVRQLHRGGGFVPKEELIALCGFHPADHGHFQQLDRLLQGSADWKIRRKGNECQLVPPASWIQKYRPPVEPTDEGDTQLPPTPSTEGEPTESGPTAPAPPGTVPAAPLPDPFRGNPLATYQEQYPYHSREELRNANPTLYERMAEDDLLSFVPRRRQTEFLIENDSDLMATIAADVRYWSYTTEKRLIRRRLRSALAPQPLDPLDSLQLREVPEGRRMIDEDGNEQRWLMSGAGMDGIDWVADQRMLVERHENPPVESMPVVPRVYREYFHGLMVAAVRAIARHQDPAYAVRRCTGHFFGRIIKENATGHRIAPALRARPIQFEDPVVHKIRRRDDAYLYRESTVPDADDADTECTPEEW